jgi:hypothetical protein
MGGPPRPPPDVAMWRSLEEQKRADELMRGHVTQLVTASVEERVERAPVGRVDAMSIPAERGCRVISERGEAGPVGDVAHCRGVAGIEREGFEHICLTARPSTSAPPRGKAARYAGPGCRCCSRQERLFALRSGDQSQRSPSSLAKRDTTPDRPPLSGPC